MLATGSSLAGPIRVLTISQPDTTRSYGELLLSTSSSDHGEAAFVLFELVRICKSDKAPQLTSITPSTLIARRSWCRRVPRGEDYMRWLRRSREAGYIPAALEFLYLPAEERSPPEAAPAAAAVEHDQLVRAMRAAAQAGSVQAMSWLAYGHLGDTAEDHVTNYAFGLTAQQELQSAVAQGALGETRSDLRFIRHLSKSIAFSLRMVGSQLDAEQIARAQALKISILQTLPSCCLFVRFLEGS